MNKRRFLKLLASIPFWPKGVISTPAPLPPKQWASLDPAFNGPTLVWRAEDYQGELRWVRFERWEQKINDPHH